MPTKDKMPGFFIDENLPKKLWKAMRAAGYPAARAVDEHLQGKTDYTVFRQVSQRAIIITRDQDFLRTDLFPPPHSGIIVINLRKDISITELVTIVMNALNTLVHEELTNKVYIIEENQILRSS
ncbi:MAG TPA: DUF5615 family PIN-like protein [Ktedonobacteraceae bacterium]|jgi:predicted nuclease of predicted toxin-antitoxin system|nr:DUF5615 family PIN-like protein [Ktedonobacteraceae bacterium]